MGNADSSFRGGARVFTDTFKSGGAFDTLFRVKMVKGIENQINSLLLNKDATIPKDVMLLLNTLQTGVGEAWGTSIKAVMKTAQDAQKVANSVGTYLDKVWDKEKWNIIALFIILNPFAFISFAIPLLSFTIMLYFFLMKRIFHPIVTRFFRHIIFKTKT
jgi:hypothetical protein